VHWRTSPFALAAAVAVLYAYGYVAGSLLVDRRDDRASLTWAIIRLVAGLLLTTLSFFLCLVLSLPWFLGPAGVLAAAVWRRRAHAFLPPRPRLTFGWDAAAGGVLGAVMLAPIVISAARMAPGEFAPVFFNVDSAYFLEQVQSLARTDTYPPPSLSNAGFSRAYHFATHGFAALISRTSGLAPHQSLFAIVLPLLAVAVLAAAAAAARVLSPQVPRVISIPLLLIPVPSFWYSFWNAIGPDVRNALSTRTLAPLDAVTQNYELWGPASIVGQNVGAHFLVLASLAALAAAPTRGWRLPVFLIGTGVLIKTSTGVALLAGFFLVELWRAVTARRVRPSAPAVAVVALFAATYLLFWTLPSVPQEFAIEPAWLFHLARIRERGGLIGLAADVLWLLLPAALVALARGGDPERRSVPLLLFGLAPFIVVNLTRSLDVRPGGGGASDDWLQVLLPVPFVLHAFVLSLAGARWHRLGGTIKTAFVVLMALTIVPPVFVAGRYSRLLIEDPEEGHEYVDNRAIAEALAAIPRDTALVVTNDLRHPAQNFGRDNRQMQIPALFGHQAFAVNYAYEVFEFSRSRQALQPLLQAEAWSPAIDEAARVHGWTHLLIHKDYVHPRPVPLERVFENQRYAVYRFEAAPATGPARPSAGP
jgi:hypothetical protein